MNPFRVVVVEPCQLFREGIAQLLHRCDLAPIALGKAFADVFDRINGSDLPDVAICGVERDTDLEAWQRELAAARTEFSFRVIVLAPSSDRQRVSRRVGSDIDAVLSKDISGDVLRRSLELVMLGQQLFPALEAGCPETEADRPAAVSGGPANPVRPVSELEAGLLRPIRTRSGTSGDVLLSEREDQILLYLVAGSPNKLIGRSLGISEATVKVHIKGLLRKLNAANRTQAAIWAVNHGMKLNSGLPMPRLVNGVNLNLPQLQLADD